MYKNRRQFARRRAAAFPHLESRHAEGIPLLVMLSVIRPKMENRIEKKTNLESRWVATKAFICRQLSEKTCCCFPFESLGARGEKARKNFTVLSLLKEHVDRHCWSETFSLWIVFILHISQQLFIFFLQLFRILNSQETWQYALVAALWLALPCVLRRGTISLLCSKK